MALYLYLVYVDQSKYTTALGTGSSQRQEEEVWEAKFDAVSAKLLFRKQERYFRCLFVCVLIIHMISLLNKSDEMLRLPRDLDGCQAQVNPFHLHQMKHRK